MTGPSSMAARRAGMRGVLDGWRLTPALLGGLAGAWLLVTAATRLGMPPINPTQYVVPRPMESLATVTLVLPVAVTTAMLPARVPWLSAVAGRDLRRYRAGILLALLAGQLPLVALVTWVGVLPFGQVTAVWLLLSSLGVLGITVGRRLGGLLPACVVLTFSQSSGLPPFAWNVFYNLDRRPVLVAVDAVLLPVALALYARRADR